MSAMTHAVSVVSTAASYVVAFLCRTRQSGLTCKQTASARCCCTYHPGTSSTTGLRNAVCTSNLTSLSWVSKHHNGPSSADLIPSDIDTAPRSVAKKPHTAALPPPRHIRRGCRPNSNHGFASTCLRPRACPFPPPPITPHTPHTGYADLLPASLRPRAQNHRCPAQRQRTSRTWEGASSLLPPGRTWIHLRIGGPPQLLCQKVEHDSSFFFDFAHWVALMACEGMYRPPNTDFTKLVHITVNRRRTDRQPRLNFSTYCARASDAGRTESPPDVAPTPLLPAPPPEPTVVSHIDPPAESSVASPTLFLNSSRHPRSHTLHGTRAASSVGFMLSCSAGFSSPVKSSSITLWNNPTTVGGIASRVSAVDST